MSALLLLRQCVHICLPNHGTVASELSSWQVAAGHTQSCTALLSVVSNLNKLYYHKHTRANITSCMSLLAANQSNVNLKPAR